MARNSVFRITIVMSLIFISHVNAGYRCTVPDGSTGHCILFEQCEQLNAMIKSRIYSRIQYVRKSQCGTVGRQVYVCCPRDNARVREIRKDRGTLPDHMVCGKQFSNRIVGGRETRLGEHPWAAQIIHQIRTKRGLRRTHLCGGSLISSLYVLTAAHCFNSGNWTPTRVRLGEWDTTTNPDCDIDVFGYVDCAPAHIDIDIETTISHPKYRHEDPNIANDIALIRLARPVTFTDFVQPICLPIENSLRSRNHEGERMEVVGWGKTETATSSKRKLKASIPVVSWATCNTKYATKGANLSASHLCAGGKVGIDQCSGDSGGPLIGLGHTRRNQTFLFLAGISSFGTRPCGVGWPGIYTRVSSFIDWIEDNLQP